MGPAQQSKYKNLLSRLQTRTDLPEWMLYIRYAQCHPLQVKDKKNGLTRGPDFGHFLYEESSVWTLCRASSGSRAKRLLTDSHRAPPVTGRKRFVCSTSIEVGMSWLDRALKLAHRNASGVSPGSPSKPTGTRART